MPLHAPSSTLRPHPTGGYDTVAVVGGNQYFTRAGILHREDGPALVTAEGDRHWFRMGLRHRDDGPAVVARGGREQFFFDGIRHPAPPF